MALTAGAPAPRSAPSAGARWQWLAAGCGLPGVAIELAPGPGRWRQRPGVAGVLRIDPAEAPRRSRLQVLRHCADAEPAGRLGWRPQGPADQDLLPPGWPAPHAAATLAEALAAWRSPLLWRLFLALDGLRVDALLAARFPGVRADLAADPAPRPRLPQACLVAWQQVLQSPPAADAGEALRRALAVWQQARPADAWPRPGGSPHTEPARRLRITAPGAVAEGGDATGTAATPGSGPDDGSARATDSPAAGGSQADPRDQDRPGAGAASPTGMATTADGPAASGLATGSSPAPATAPGHTAPPALPDLAAGPVRHCVAPRPPARLTRHDEWDSQARRLLLGWTTVHERPRDADPPDASAATAPAGDLRAALRQRHPALLRRLQRLVGRGPGAAPERVRRLPDGDTIDIGAALDALAERRAGSGTDARWHQARRLQARELCVVVLLDTSSSTAITVPDPGTARPQAAAATDDDDEPLWMARPWRADATPRRRVLDLAQDAVALLCEALTALGDRHAVLAYAGDGRHQVSVEVVKGFDQPWSAARAAALASLEPGGATRTGAAVRQALLHLQQQPARRKLLVLVSDGYPQDRDYGPDPKDPRYGLLDTAHALRQARRAGVAAFHVSVDAGAHDYLRQICPPQHHWVLHQPADLPRRMLALAHWLTRHG